MPGLRDRKLTLGGFALLAAIGLSACTSSKVHDDMPAADGTSGKDDPYPDFSRPLTSAMNQMSNEEAKRMETQLTALAGQRRSGAISESEYWRRVNELRRLNESVREPEAVN